MISPYACLLVSSLTDAVVIFPYSDPQGPYTQACVDALSTNITQCPVGITSLDANTAYTEKGLGTLCTDNCRSALQSWESSVKASCHGASFTNDYGNTVPIYSVASLINFKFNQTCLVSDGEYCNIVLGNLTATSSQWVGRRQ